MTIAKLYVEDIESSKEKYVSIHEELLKLKFLLQKFKYHTVSGWGKGYGKLATSVNTAKRKYGICYELVGAAAYLWKNVIKSKREICALAMFPVDEGGHSTLLIEDDDGEHVYLVEAHAGAKATILRYSCYDAVYCYAQKWLVSAHCYHAVYDLVEQQTILEKTIAKVKSALDSMKSVAIKYDPLDDAMYNCDIPNFKKRIIKKYGTIDFKKVDNSREKDAIETII